MTELGAGFAPLHSALSFSGAVNGPWLPFLGVFICAAVLTAGLVKLGTRKGWVSIPRPDRWNSRVVAMFGGVPVLLAFASGSVFLSLDKPAVVLLLLTMLMGAVGLTDDLVGVGPKTKLFSQATLASLVVLSGTVFSLTGHFWIDAIFTVFWITGITNAVNLVDNMDGLAAGIAIIALAQIFLLAGPDLVVSRLALCMLVAIAGFFVFNLNPAKIFMGDVGSLSIGFFLAVASLRTTGQLSQPGPVRLTPVLVLFVPVFDTLLVSVTRKLNGKPVSQGGRDHASHRLVLIGLSERQAVLFLYALAAGAGSMAFLWRAFPATLGSVMIGAFLCGAAMFWLYLAKVQLPPRLAVGSPRAMKSAAHSEVVGSH